MKAVKKTTAHVTITAESYALLLDAVEMLRYTYEPTDEAPDVDELQENFEILMRKIEKAIGGRK